MSEVLAGEFIDGTTTPQTITLRHWGQNPDGGTIETGSDYLLFLYPFEYDPGVWFGDYQISGLFSGMFKETGDGSLQLMDGAVQALSAINSVSAVKTEIAENPGRVGSEVLRAR